MANGKGDHRRPEDREAISNRWPFADPKSEKGCVVWFDREGNRHVNGTGFVPEGAVPRR